MVEISCWFRILGRILVGGSHFGRSRSLFLEIVPTILDNSPRKVLKSPKRGRLLIYHPKIRDRHKILIGIHILYRRCWSLYLCVFLKWWHFPRCSLIEEENLETGNWKEEKNPRTIFGLSASPMVRISPENYSKTQNFAVSSNLTSDSRSGIAFRTFAIFPSIFEIFFYRNFIFMIHMRNTIKNLFLGQFCA